MDACIEEGTANIYEDDIDKALENIEKALLLLQVRYQQVTIQQAQQAFEKVPQSIQTEKPEKQQLLIYNLVIYYNLSACYQRLTRLIEVQQNKVEDEILQLKSKNLFSNQNLKEYSQNLQHQNEEEKISQKSIQKFPQVRNSVSNNNETPEQYKLLHYKRYLTKLTLQSCAIKSQLEQHDVALDGAKAGLKICIEVFNTSYQMCKNEIQGTLQFQDSDKHQQMSKIKSKSMLNNGSKGSKIENISKEAEQCRSRTPNRQSLNNVAKRQSIDKFQKRRQSHDPKIKYNLQYQKSAQQTYSPEPSSSVKKQNLRMAYQRQSISPNSPYSKTSQKSDQLANNILKLNQANETKKFGSRKSSIKSTLKFHMSGSEDEQSLERIHTFNLKSDIRAVNMLNFKKSEILSNYDENDTISPQKIKQLMLYKELGPVLSKISDEKQSINNLVKSPGQNDLLMTSISTRDQFTSPKLREKYLITEDRRREKQLATNCYVEEQARILDSFMIDSYNILKSLISRLNHFMIYSSFSQQRNTDILKELINFEEFSFQEQHKKPINKVNLLKKLKIVKNFTNTQQIDILRKSDKYKYAGRNVLGVRQIEDWINSLEIGHVMQLNPMTSQELTQAINKHHEFQKDPMLEKLVLLVVAFFSIGTEMRLIVDEDKQNDMFKQSELWHAQSVFFGSYFVPIQCPLVTHVINSYFKHYIEGQEQKQIVEISQQIPVESTKQKPNLQVGPLQAKKPKKIKTQNLQKYMIKELKHNSNELKNLSPKTKSHLTSQSKELRQSSQGLRAKRETSQKDTTRKKSKSKIALKIRKSKERSKSPTSYTLSQDNKMIIKKKMLSPNKKPKILSSNNSKINLLKGFLSNTLQKDQQSNSKNLLKKSNMFENTFTMLNRNPSSQTFQQDIININVPVNIDQLSNRIYETSLSNIPSLNYQYQTQQQNHILDQQQFQTCKNNQQKHFVFIPDDHASDIESTVSARERYSMGPLFQNQKRTSLGLQNSIQPKIVSKENIVQKIVKNQTLLDLSQRRQSLNLSQKKLIDSKLNLIRQKGPSRNSLQKQHHTVGLTSQGSQSQGSVQFVSRGSISSNNFNEALEKQRLKQIKSFSRQAMNQNHQQQQSRYSSPKDGLMSRQNQASQERFPNSKTVQVLNGNSNLMQLQQQQKYNLNSPQATNETIKLMSYQNQLGTQNSTILPPKSNQKANPRQNHQKTKEKIKNGNNQIQHSQKHLFINQGSVGSDTQRKNSNNLQYISQNGNGTVKMNLKKYINN
eukprot:403344459